jgi:hypothetical protein
MLCGMEIGYPDSVVIGGSKVTMSYANVVPLNGTNNFCRGDFRSHPVKLNRAFTYSDLEEQLL